MFTKVFGFLITTSCFFYIYAAAEANIYNLKAVDINNKTIDFERYKGKVLLIVNTASGCGYTPQLSGLQSLYEKNKKNSFEVLAFPSNDFKQESLSGSEIKTFCEKKYKTTFPLFEKIHVKGKDIHPLFSYLVKNSDTPNLDVRWNFEKFLVDKKGKVIGRYKSEVKPQSEKIEKDIKKALAEK